MPSSLHSTFLIYLLKVLLVDVYCDDFNQISSERTSKNYSSCGEVHFEKHFLLKSPNYPENYPANLQCHYLLKGPPCPTYYQFQFLNFSLENSAACIKDSFVIDEQDVLCGNHNKTKSYFAANGSLHVIFSTNENNSNKGYLIEVTRLPCKFGLVPAPATGNTKIFKEVAKYPKEGNGFNISAIDNINISSLSLHYVRSINSTTTRAPSIENRMFLPKTKEETNHCCKTIYNTKNFIITSPNFPYTLNKKEECSFEIHKANDDICRLRLNFLFFWVGYTNRDNCPHGYLEIDGKYICGCNSNLKLMTTFGISNKKRLTFKTESYYQTYKTGFVIEVIQDECPNKYSPENLTNQYHIDNDQINRIAWPTDSNNIIEKLHLINERTEILDDATEKTFSKIQPQIIKSVYVFAPPEYDDIPSLHSNKEETSYLDTSRITSVATNSNYYQCLYWNQIQYDFLSKKYGRNLKCPREDERADSSEDKRQCVDLSYIKGYFRSPGYPCYYPANLNICYRLRKQPGYCTVKIFVHDFQIENSIHCAKDYFLLANGEKHCGNNLDKASWTMDLRYTDHEDMIFVTDNYYCARGFSGVYQQIACQDDIPNYPIDTTTSPVIPTTPGNYYCNKVIRKKSFIFEVNKDHRMCTFSIQKYKENVCKINFYFEKFDLVCAVESIVLDGRMYCGHLTGKTVTVNLNAESLDVVYRSTLLNKYGDLRFTIRGEQITDDCIFLEAPEVQRLTNLVPRVIQPPSENTIQENNILRKPSKYLIAFIDKNFKDICGVVTDKTDRELPSSFCEILSNDHNVTKCTQLQEEILPKEPYEVRNLGTKLQDNIMKEFKETDIQEIDCDNLPE